MTDRSRAEPGSALDDLSWRLVPEEFRDGPTQMALEEVAARTAVDEGLCTVRAFGWEPSTLSMGYGQDPETVDWDYCDRAGIAVTRRQTGGGGIYHDEFGDVSYTIVVPKSAVPGDLMDSYELLCAPIFDALERMGIEATFAETEQPARYQPACYLRDINPAHDVVVDGRKISGNAQYRQRDAVIQHGSIHFEPVVDRHLGVFDEPGVDEADFRERVTSVREEARISREETVEVVESALAAWSGADVGAWSDDELGAAEALAKEKYASEEWIHRSPR